jgi:hypothetical protein
MFSASELAYTCFLIASTTLSGLYRLHFVHFDIVLMLSAVVIRHVSRTLSLFLPLPAMGFLATAEHFNNYWKLHFKNLISKCWMV